MLRDKGFFQSFGWSQDRFDCIPNFSMNSDKLSDNPCFSNFCDSKYNGFCFIKDRCVTACLGNGIIFVCIYVCMCKIMCSK